jgi:hypothetical protein
VRACVRVCVCMCHASYNYYLKRNPLRKAERARFTIRFDTSMFLTCQMKHATREVLLRCCRKNSGLYNREVMNVWSYAAIAAMYLHVAVRT